MIKLDLYRVTIPDDRRVFFVSDTHFFHSKLTRGCPNAFQNPRRYYDVSEMNDDIIRQWRDTVGDNDLVVFMGDFLFNTPCKEQLRVYEELISQLPHKDFIWVKGNHDGVLAKILHKAAFDNQPAVMCHAMIMQYRGRAYVCQHRSYDEDNTILCKHPIDPPVVLVHGHTHAYERITNTGIDLYPTQNNVCWEVEYKPIDATTLYASRR